MSNGSVLIRGRKELTDMRRETMWRQAEMGVTLLGAKEHEKPPEAGKGRKMCPVELQKELGLPAPWVQTCRLWNHVWEIHFCCSSHHHVFAAVICSGVPRKLYRFFLPFWFCSSYYVRILSSLSKDWGTLSLWQPQRQGVGGELMLILTKPVQIRAADGPVAWLGGHLNPDLIPGSSLQGSSCFHPYFVPSLSPTKHCLRLL